MTKIFISWLTGDGFAFSRHITFKFIDLSACMFSIQISRRHGQWESGIVHEYRWYSLAPVEWSHGVCPWTIWPSTVQFRIEIGRLWCMVKTMVYAVSFEGTAVCRSLQLVLIAIISSTLVLIKLQGQGRLIMTGLEQRRWTWLWTANGLSQNRHRRKLSTRRILAEVSPRFRQTILLSRWSGGRLSIAHCIYVPENGILALWARDEGDEQSSFCPSQHSSQIHVDIYAARYLFLFVRLVERRNSHERRR